MNDEFPIGWEPRLPPATGRFVRRVVLTLAFAVLGTVGVVAWRQGDFPPARFGYGEDTLLTGHADADPAPRLRLADGRDVLLVGEGKHGAHDLVAGLAGAAVSVTGYPIQRGARRALEVHALERTGTGAVPPAPPVDLGPATLHGEIVDGKCWLGVMNPGAGKVHRGCAARCLSGGAPPLLVTDSTVVLLVVPDARALLPWVAEPVAVSGALVRDGGLLVLRTDPSAIRRL